MVDRECIAAGAENASMNLNVTQSPRHLVMNREDLSQDHQDHVEADLAPHEVMLLHTEDVIDLVIVIVANCPLFLSLLTSNHFTF